MQYLYLGFASEFLIPLKNAVIIGLRLARSGEVEPVWIGLGVRGDFSQDGFGNGLRAPAPDAGGFGGVEDHPGNIERARGVVDGDRVLAVFRGTPVAELAERAG